MSTTVQATDTLSQWQGVAKYWAEHRTTIRQMFAPVTQALIEDAAICEGKHVLDLAAGPGEPSLTIAETVGTTGSVTCTDVVAEMVEAAEAEARQRGLRNIRFLQCPAEALPFPNHSFDVVVSRLGAMFFPDKAFAEILRATKPGGVIALAVWYKSDLNPFGYVVSNVMSRHVETPPVDPNAPGAFRFAESGKLAGVLKDAGAVDLGERLLRFDMIASISPQEFWTMRKATSDTLRTKLATLPETVRSQIATEVLEAIPDFFPNNQIKFPAQMLIVTAKKPG